MATVVYATRTGVNGIVVNSLQGGFTSGRQHAPDVIAREDGRFAVGYSSTGQVNQLALLDADLSLQTVSTIILGNATGTGAPALLELSDGNIAIAYRVDAAVDIERSVVINGATGASISNRSYDTAGPFNGPPAITTRGTGFATFYGDNGYGTEEATLWAFTASGADDNSINNNFIPYREIQQASSAQVNGTAVTTLSNGNIAMMWRDSVSTALSWRVVTANGALVAGGEGFDQFGTNGAPRLAALANGGFVAAYTDTGWETGTTDITLAFFSGTGFLNYVNATNLGDDTIAPDITVHGNGFISLSYLRAGSSFIPPSLPIFFEYVETRSYDATGAYLTGSQKTLSTSASTLSPTSISAGANGRFGLAWESDSSGSFDGSGNAVLLAVQDLWRDTTGDATGETLAGDALRDRMVGNDGNDLLSGLGGDDSLIGGSGDDTLVGGAGNDLLSGGGDNDVYQIEQSGDQVSEAAAGGEDTAYFGFTGGTMPSHVEIGRLFGSAQSLAAGAQAVQLVTNPTVASTLTGGADHDVLWSSILADSLDGGGGDDIIRGQGGADTMRGGAGNDQFVVFDAGVMIIEAAGGGEDTAWVTVNGLTVGDHVEITRLAGNATSVTGGATNEQLVVNPLFASTLNGGAGDDLLWGSTGTDVLLGGEGDDIIRGQGGSFDQMAGGGGNDQYVLLAGGLAIITEALDAGYDTLWSAFNNLVMPQNVERVNLAGTAHQYEGNALDNVMVGNPTLGNILRGREGHDIIFGSSLADTLTGDAGNDVLYSGGGADRFLYPTLNWGYDQISGFVQGQARISFAGTGLQFSNLFLNSANGNTQIEVGGNAVLVFGVAGMSGTDFLFDLIG